MKYKIFAKFPDGTTDTMELPANHPAIAMGMACIMWENKGRIDAPIFVSIEAIKP
jgi:hypothetical protein